MHPFTSSKSAIPAGPDSTGGSPPARLLGFGRHPGWRGELRLLGFLALCTLVLSWPIPVTLGQATGLRGDYFNNLWNVWWLRHALGEGTSPYATDYLYWPEGLSLMRHTLSPLNALAGLLSSTFLSPHAAFNVVLLGNFLLSAWGMSLLARYVTGSVSGGVLAGLIYSFCPFHYYYLCQINVFSTGWLPLVALFYLRVYREGGWRNTLGAALSTGAVAATAEYYVMYGVLFVALLLALGRALLDREVPWRPAATRVVAAGALTGLVVVLVAWPLLYGTFGPERLEAGTSITGLQGKRANDLFGYEWVGGPEKLTVSWPTMLGYSVLLLILSRAGRVWRRQRFFLAVGLVFLVLSLGKELAIGREETGIPLLYQWLSLVPGLDMLRKPDRAFLMVQFVAALCVAEAWAGWRERLASPRVRLGAWSGVALMTLAEVSGVPFARLDYETPAYLAELREDESVETVAECPPMWVDVMNARFCYYQLTHEKKGQLGYSTLLAKGIRAEEQMNCVVNAYLAWLQGLRHEAGCEAADYPDWVRRSGYDRVILYKSMPIEREKLPLHETVVWKPFFLVKRDLVGIRQVGQYLDQPTDPMQLLELKRMFRRAFGTPVHEDEELIVFDPARSPKR